MPASRIEAQLSRQFDAVKHLPISHIDSHQHLHALPAIMRVVCRFASQRGIPAIRLPADGPAFAYVPPARRAQAAALAATARLSQRHITASGLRTSDHFSGMAVSGHLTAPVLAAYLRSARPGLTEIVCHPGADNSALSQVFDWGYDWQGELDALRSEEAHGALASSAVRISTWAGP